MADTGYGDKVNGPFSYAGGSSIIPEYWSDKLGKALQTHTLWSKFSTPVVVDVPLMQKGAGKTVNWSHTTDIDASAGGTLTAGTVIPFASTTLVNGNADIVEFGKAIGLEGFPIWLSDSAYQPFADIAQGKQGLDAITSLVNWGAKTWDRWVGAVALTTPVAFTPRSGSTWEYGTGTGAADGTTAMTLAALHGLRSNLLRNGISPRPELGNRYAFIGQAGAHDWLANLDGVQRDAASLGLGGPYLNGFVAEKGGFVFYEEVGANSICTYSASAGTSVVLGADAIAADSNMGQEPNYLVWYPDPSNDSGRRKQANIYFLGISAMLLPILATWTSHRAVRVHYAQ